MKIRFDLPPESPQQSNGLAVPYGAARRPVARWRWYLLLAVVCAPPLYLAWRFAAAYWWETAPAFVAMPDVVVKAGVAGRIGRLAPVGAQVLQGQPLGELLVETSAPAAAPASAPVPPPSPDLLAQHARAGEVLRLAEEQLGLREQRLASTRRLVEQGAATAGELATMQSHWLAARADVVRARTDLSAVRGAMTPSAASGPTYVSPASGVTAPALAIAPVNGRVMHVYARAGEWVGPDTEVSLLRGEGEPRVLAYVPPAEVRYALAGRRASLRFGDGTVIPAVVEAVAPEAQRLPTERVAPLAQRGQAVVVELRPERPLPERYRIHHLPLDVRFKYVWPWAAWP